MFLSPLKTIQPFFHLHLTFPTTSQTSLCLCTTNHNSTYPSARPHCPGREAMQASSLPLANWSSKWASSFCPSCLFASFLNTCLLFFFSSSTTSADSCKIQPHSHQFSTNRRQTLPKVSPCNPTHPTTIPKHTYLLTLLSTSTHTIRFPTPTYPLPLFSTH